MPHTSTGQKNSTFFIKHFDDYHEIRSKTHKYIELGCFPPKKDNPGYCRYFGLFWKGRKPSIAKVIASLKKKIDLSGENRHYFSNVDISINLKDLTEEVQSMMSDNGEGPDEE